MLTGMASVEVYLTVDANSDNKFPQCIVFIHLMVEIYDFFECWPKCFPLGVGMCCRRLIRWLFFSSVILRGNGIIFRVV